MNLWHRVHPDKVKPDNFLACIEISKGSKNKYELDKYSGALVLDRVLYTSTHYPQNYGFIPRTLAADGDALDVLVLCSEAIIPLALVECYPIGMLEMTDSGYTDTKIIAICKHDPIYNGYKDIEDIPEHIFDELSHFFRVYKELEGKVTVVNNVLGKDAAIHTIKVCMDEYNKAFPEK